MFIIHDSERYERKNRMEEIKRMMKEILFPEPMADNKCQEHGETKPCIRCTVGAYEAYESIGEILHENPETPLASICRYLVTVHSSADILVALSDAFQNESNEMMNKIYKEDPTIEMRQAIDASVVAQKVLRVQRELEVRK